MTKAAPQPVPKLVQALNELLEDDQFTNPETNEVDLTKITYRDVIRVFAATQMEEEHLISDVRDMVRAEISFGIATIMKDGGPANPANTLRYEGIMALLKLWRETVACQADLDGEQRRNRELLLEMAEIEEGGKKGGGDARP